MKLLRLFSLILLCALGSVQAQTQGIFAVFSTSMGEFTVFLDHEAAPRAVASFVGLATGEKSWADETGTVWMDRPFYDGSLIHRVVKDTVSTPGVTNNEAFQGGGWLWRSVDTNGVVTTNITNAGYYQLENVTNGLTHSNGVISMANSGPNTDSSQFFITAMNVPRWDGNYTVFGHVTTGMNVVTSIAAVAIGTAARPLVDVVVSNVAIRRVGAATNFNIAAQGVPVVESGPMAATPSGSNMVLEIELLEQSELRFRESADLVTWDSADWGYHTSATTNLVGLLPASSLFRKYFFHASRIWYPVPITAPINHRGRVYTFVWNTVPAVTNESHFGPNAATPGVSYEWAGTNTVATSQLISGGESWTQDAYSAYLVSLDSRFYYYYYSLGFNPGAATNRFFCRRVHGITGDTFQFSGTFTVQ